MKKWYGEEYKFTVVVAGFMSGARTGHCCRNREEPGDVYRCAGGCPANAQGEGICSKAMMMLCPLMEAVRSGGDLTSLGGKGRYEKTVVCPDGCVMSQLTAKPLGSESFHRGGFWHGPQPREEARP